MTPDPTHIDIARFGPEAAAAELTYLVRGLVRAAGGEVELAPGWEADLDEIVASTPLADGSVVIRVVPRVREDDERVPAGGWIHVLSGQAVRVDGISHEGLVVVHHQTGEPNEHRADQTVEEFLSTHVRADNVPFIGDNT